MGGKVEREDKANENSSAIKETADKMYYRMNMELVRFVGMRGVGSVGLDGGIRDGRRIARIVVRTVDKGI